jgi:hemerythrin superfamily protein
MSIIDKALGAITPPESDEKRVEATRKAREAAGDGDWLSLALDHHDRIRAAFEACCRAEGAETRQTAMKQLALILTGHSQAEEVVLYPALAKAGEKGSADLAYTEQVTAKMQMAELERIAPATPDWLEKVEHIRGAVLHHMYEEEDHWFIRLKEQNPDQAFLTRRFREEFSRYLGPDGSVEGESGLLRQSEDRSWDIPETRPDAGTQ